MCLVEDKTFFGKNYKTKGELEISNLGFVSCAIGPGKEKDFNEDCLRIGNSNDYYYYTVTDGHWGSKAAEYMTGKIIDELNNHLKATIMDQLKADIDEKNLKSELSNIITTHTKNIAKRTESETTFLYLFIKKDFIVWISLGDSFLALVEKSGKIIENKKFKSWIGKRISNDLISNHCEIGFLNSTKNLLGFTLMSDGIPECLVDKQIIPLSEIANEFKRYTKSEEIVKKISNKALDLGGEDNIAMIVGYFRDLELN